MQYVSESAINTHMLGSELTPAKASRLELQSAEVTDFQCGMKV